MDLLMQLNEPQRTACAKTDGPVLILAGAGSGKTRTLTYRVAHLIQDKGVDPGEILAFTFTNKAAREMSERISDLIGADSKHMWVGTFHAICVRMLRQDIERLGFGARFLIYDTDDQKALMRAIIRELNWDEKKFPAGMMLGQISRAKNNFIDPEHWQDFSFMGERVQEVFRRYRERLRALNALDFDDLIYYAVQLLEQHPDVLSRYHRRFQHVLVDEYQDTNMAQYRMIELMARGHGNLCVVGDDDQAIYGWRGADMRNILEFQKQFSGATVVRLEENYRSTSVILDAANAVVEHNQERLGKALWTSREGGSKIRWYLAPDEESEAWYAAEIIHEAVGRGLSPSDCAVLYRTNAQSRALEMALARAGIGYRLVGGKRFYERKEVKDLLAYLKVMYNPQDDVALARIINFPRRGIGDVAIGHLVQAARDRDLSLYDTLGQAGKIDGLTPAAQKAAMDLWSQFEQWQDMAEEDLAVLVQRVAQESGLLQFFSSEGGREGEERVENVGELISEAKRFQETEGVNDLGAFLGFLALVSDWEATEDRGQGAWLMTIHSAKGLEFPLVVLVGMEEGVFPHVRSIEESRVEEERRLCYVGLTRARDELYLTAAETRTIMGRTESHPISRFVSEIPKELLEAPGNRGSAGAASATMRTTVPEGGYQEGDRLRHPRFGWGTVVSQRGSGDDLELTIAFPGGGIRSFLAKYAQLGREQEDA
jgi:DNA helicase-2/ATP-dependent DNA helicase PcrA